jgi:hypothetical protein
LRLPRTVRFSTFLGGTLLGKGVIKASWQAALFTMAFSTPARTVFVARVGHALDRVLPASLQARSCAGHIHARNCAGLSRCCGAAQASQRLQQLALNLPARLAAGVQARQRTQHAVKRLQPVRMSDGAPVCRLRRVAPTCHSLGVQQ